MGHIVKCDYGTIPGCLSDSKGCLSVDVQEYATAQDMMLSTCLKLGYAHTLGFYEVGDGGAAYYTVVAAPTGDQPNGMDVLQCRKGLVAELVDDSAVYIEQIGGINNVERAFQIANTVIFSKEYTDLNIAAQNKVIKINKCQSLTVTTLEGCTIELNEISGNNCIVFNPKGNTIGTRIANNNVKFNTIYTSSVGISIDCINGSFFNNKIEGNLIRGNGNTTAINTITNNISSTYANSNNITVKSIFKHNTGFKVSSNKTNCYSHNINAAFEECENAVVCSNVNNINYKINCTERTSGIIEIDTTNTGVYIEFDGLISIDNLKINTARTDVVLIGTFIDAKGNIIANKIYNKTDIWFYTPYLNTSNLNQTINGKTIYNDNASLVQGSGILTLDCATPNGYKIICVRAATSKQTLNLTINGINETIPINNYPSFIIVSIINRVLIYKTI